MIVRNGSIPASAVIHHKCRNRLCVNPNHLEMIKDNPTHLRRNNDQLLNKVFGVKGGNR